MNDPSDPKNPSDPNNPGDTASRTISVDCLARVEGEGALHIKTRGDTVEQVELRIFEPPRFFEAFVRGRHALEAPDLTARICGICPVAYQMSSSHALERAFHIEITPTIRRLRRLLYCGEWIESHALHVYMLHAPDFFGEHDVVALSRRFPELVAGGLLLKKTGNEILRVLGGREIHPINIRVGGFYKWPTVAALRSLAEPLKRALDHAVATVRWVAGFAFPDIERDYEFVCLQNPNRPLEYPLNEGQVISSGGLRIDVDDFDQHFAETQVQHSNALHAHTGGRSYLVGPLARYALCGDRLPRIARQAVAFSGLLPVCKNPYQSIVVRAIELVFACEEALNIVTEYAPEGPPFVPFVPQKASGAAATCAPRGLLFQRYDLLQDGTIARCNIVPPTAQNQASIEEDLRLVAQKHLHLPLKQLTALCEQAVRNHDPCISCATHFLRLEISDHAKVLQNN